MKRRDAQAKSLDGRIIKKPVKKHNSRSRSAFLYGRLKYLGEEHRPKYFLARYQNGNTERLSMRQVANILTPPSTEMPEAATAQSLSSLTSQLPMFWDLSKPNELAHALSLLMPGKHSLSHISRLSHLAPGGSRFLQPAAKHNPGYPQCVTMNIDEVMCLVQAIDFSAVQKVCDPFAGTCTIQRALRTIGVNTITNDINQSFPTDEHLDAFQPAFYANQHLDLIVTSPPFSFLDLVIPLMFHYTTRLLCVHIPGHYLTDAPPYRQQFLSLLHSKGLLHVQIGLPRGPVGRKCLWLIMFKDIKSKLELCKPLGSSRPLLWAMH
jgi:hypothetical protein